MGILIAIGFVLFVIIGPLLVIKLRSGSSVDSMGGMVIE